MLLAAGAYDLLQSSRGDAERAELAAEYRRMTAAAAVAAAAAAPGGPPGGGGGAAVAASDAT
jgi:hypothetical protein